MQYISVYEKDKEIGCGVKVFYQKFQSASWRIEIFEKAL